MADGESVGWQTTLSDKLSREQWPEALIDIVEKLSIGTPYPRKMVSSYSITKILIRWDT